MSDLKYTPEQLEAMVEEQAGIIAALQNDIAELKTKTSAAEIKAGAKVVRKPAIPGGTVKVGKKEYKWTKAQFKILGDATLYTAEEAQHDKDLLKKIVDIPGQKILQEQV